MGELTRPKMIRAEGYVWCHDHGTIHDDTTDPYRYGEKDCRKSEHRPVYYRAKRGDQED